MKNQAQYSANVLYIMFSFLGDSCVSNHDCNFYLQDKRFYFIRYFYIVLVSLCFFSIMEHFNMHF